MSKKLHNDKDPREKTRAALARTVLFVLSVLAVATLALIAFARPLGLMAEGIRLSALVFTSVSGLTLIAFKWYFWRQR